MKHPAGTDSQHSQETRGATRGYKPHLDSLRAVAVAAVAWSHWERGHQFGIPFGAGVQLFYVLSGFLITGILLGIRDLGHRGHAIGAFYIRRALRIAPAFYLTLFLAWWADLPLVRESLAWHAAYLSNVFVFARGEWPGTISHLWSLAVEEQFYLLWPWFIVYAPAGWLLPGILTAVAAAPMLRVWLAAEGVPASLQGVLTPGCFDSLGVGALLALMATRGAARPVAGRLLRLGAPTWLVVTALNAAGLAPPALVAMNQTFLACVFGWIVVRAVDGYSGRVGRVLSLAPVLYLGRISYGVYLAHGFAGAIAAGLLSLGGVAWPLPEPYRFVSLCVVTVATAALSWHLLERPVNGLKRRFPYRAAAARYGLPRLLSADSAP